MIFAVMILAIIATIPAMLFALATFRPSRRLCQCRHRCEGTNREH
jgi:hypothetical protein